MTNLKTLTVQIWLPKKALFCPSEVRSANSKTGIATNPSGTGAAQQGHSVPKPKELSAPPSTMGHAGTPSSLKSPLLLIENQRYIPKFPALAVWRLLKRTQRLNIHWRILREPMGLLSLILSAIHSFLPDTAAIRIFQTNSEEFFSYLAYKNSTIHLTRSGFLS